ncbi:MAG: DUF3726 domain-containing protein [Octadecabacter sp.]|nr:DUF3726 domain-containing protein [Octadecabacter sp.]
MTLSRNEVQALVFKAARGGGLPLGYAEDLAVVAAYLDFAGLSRCPCQGPAQAIPVALDLVLTGERPQVVQAEPAVIAAYVAAAEAAYGRRLDVEDRADGAVLRGFSGAAGRPQTAAPRCDLPDALLAHLHDMAARTLVPETESSRQSGAGAGLSDND